ncbi:MAG: hypothetical protein JJU06_20275 [Ectothiorhodospiraceae bacterium]|nr:hypothetical protein [Ectothiorhodospiraceae bacterium]MCH8503245.1 hypothetical protein [Ectothiorhodospiraceae bacterium]
MHSITDAKGQDWDVMLGRESYGMQVLLFVASGGGEVRKAMLASDTRVDAQAELAGMDREALLERLAVSVPWGSQVMPR